VIKMENVKLGATINYAIVLIIQVHSIDLLYIQGNDN
jgi:hypothetical protein